MSMPEKPSLDGLEAKWNEWWQASGTYRFDRSKTRDQVYAIDTPPPTVSGSLHVGHVLSYTHPDLMARFKRMMGIEVFYPLGWDDNGLPTERRVQNYFGVRCEPSIPYDPAFDYAALEGPEGRDPIALSRENFIELCGRLTVEDEKAFEDLFRHLGLSVDWDHTYTTIGERSRRASQRAFLRLLAGGHAYNAEAPTMWDVDFRTAVAQAEIVDREQEGQYHRIGFDREEGGIVEIETSRPELIPACVALVVHPTDPRYAALVGSSVLTPLFRVPVPVMAHELADPEKGTGVAMICTFGDVTDIIWWRELKLPARVVMQKDGSIGRRTFGEPGWESRDPDAANAALGQIAGMYAKKARKQIVEMLRISGSLLAEPETIMHPVKFYENGARPLEVISSRQWFVRTLEHREDLLRRGAELEWHPSFMQGRFDSWVRGLNADWCISRQRFFGVPFPLWYRVNQDGEPDYDAPLMPSEARLPVDPLADVPEGFTADQRDEPGGFTGDPDIMDTWATSSLTPQIAGGWEDDPDLFSRVFPMDLRPQAHEIIRTWLFYTVLKSELEHGSLPWTNVAISGWVLDPDRKKMSKSKGNVVTPLGLLEQHGSDAVRYWAASARLGADAAFDEQQMKVGRKLAIKILNASRFTLGMEAAAGEVTEPLDRSMLAALAAVVRDATEAFAGYDHARALDLTERFFWAFTDDYLELVKQRAYGAHGEAGAASAVGALRIALDTMLRLFAPFLPFVTEEVWSWWREGSVHRAAWPTPEELITGAAQADTAIYEFGAEVLTAIRREKALQKVSLRAQVSLLTVADQMERLAMLDHIERDLKEAGNVLDVVRAESDARSVVTVLAPVEG